MFQKESLTPMAISGHNGNNETLIGMSNSLGLSFYDLNMNKVEVSLTTTPIDILIKRDLSVQTNSFNYVNATQIQLSSFYLTNAFNLTTTNASIHIELKPFNFSIGYLIVVKLGYVPILNSTFNDFSSFRILCPSNSF